MATPTRSASGSVAGSQAGVVPAASASVNNNPDSLAGAGASAPAKTEPVQAPPAPEPGRQTSPPKQEEVTAATISTNKTTFFCIA